MDRKVSCRLARTALLLVFVWHSEAVHNWPSALDVASLLADASLVRQAQSGHCAPNDSQCTPHHPEVDMDFCQISEYYGYNCTNYWNQVRTDDGFLLTVHRVNRRNTTEFPKGAVYLQHGLLCDSVSWVMLQRDSLPFVLADAGYDLWVGNSRGNTYSMKHETLRPSEEAFWAWSWDEMGQYDLPAFIDFVLGVTKETSLYYIAHSQGTLQAFTHMNTKRYQQQIRHAFALGPVFNVTYMISPIRFVAPYSQELKSIFDGLHVYDFFPRTELVKWLGEYVCEAGNLPQDLCANILFLLCGFDTKQLDKDRMDVIFAHEPAGTSVQNMFHFSQMVQTKSCARYDYGSPAQNMAHYNSSVPPSYNVTSYVTNTSVFYSENDWLADPQDVQYILKHARTITHSVSIPKWNHLDFIWAKDARSVLYDRIIDILNTL